MTINFFNVAITISLPSSFRHHDMLDKVIEHHKSRGNKRSADRAIARRATEPNVRRWRNVLSVYVGKPYQWKFEFNWNLVSRPTINIPYIARKWGHEEPACGNGYVYYGWLGTHMDL